MIPLLKPACRAKVKKVLLISSRPGKPKEILETPITVLIPRASIAAITSQATLALSPPVLIVKARGSTTILQELIPYSAAFAIIFSAIATRPATSKGIPLSSRQRATRTAPYFFAKGSTCSKLSSLPLTEFNMGLPLYKRNARSIAS